MKYRLLAGLMTLAMVLGGFPVNVIASEETEAETVMETEETAPETVQIEETAPETVQTEETAAETAQTEETEETEEIVLLDADGDVSKPKNPTALEPGKAYSAVISDGGDCVMYSFTPTKTGTYIFYSDSNEAVCATLYDSDMMQLAEDNCSRINFNFKITYEFEAGETYYFEVRFWNGPSTGTFTVRLAPDSGLRAFPKRETGDTANIDVAYGGDALLEVEVQGKDLKGVTYQWYDGGTSVEMGVRAIEGAVSASYEVTNITESAEYCCLVSDSYGFEQIVYFQFSVDNHLQVCVKGTDQNQAEYKVPFDGSKRLEVAATADDTSQLTYRWSKVILDENFEWSDTEEIKNGSEPFLAVRKVRSYSEYLCEITDQFGNYDTVYFQIYVDSGLRAYVKGTKRTDVGIRILPTETAELEVDAVSAAALTYEWFYRDDEGTEHIFKGETEPCFRIRGDELPDSSIECRVRDDYGNWEIVSFSVGIESRLKAVDKASGEEFAHVYVPLGGKTRLEVAASDGVGPLTYTWYEGNYNIIKGQSGASLNIGPVKTRASYTCTVKDSYGEEASVHFMIYVDNGFYARIHGTYDGWDKHFVLRPGNTGVTLKIDAGTADGSNVTYNWSKWSGNGKETSFKAGASYATGTVKKSTTYLCRVRDAYGNERQLYFGVSVNNITKLQAKDNKTDIYVPLNKGTTLQAEVSAYDKSKLKYEWIKDYRQTLTEKGTSLKLAKVTKAETYQFYVDDGFGESFSVDYNVYVDTGFEAHAAGTDSNEAYIKAAYGGTQVLTVDARANQGVKLRYQWYKGNGDLGNTEKISGATANTLKLTGIKYAKDYYCDISDPYGQVKQVFFHVCVDNGLSAYVAGTKETYKHMTLPAGSSALLQVDLEAKRMDDIQIAWLEGYPDDIDNTFGADIDNQETETLELKNIGQSKRYYCRIYDGCGNTATVIFDVIVDNDFTAVDQKTGKEHAVYTVDPGTNLDLTVKAGVKAGGLTYTWGGTRIDSYGDEEYLYYRNLNTTVFHVKNIQNYERYECEVTDQYGNKKNIRYDIFINNNFKAYVKGTTKTQKGMRVAYTGNAVLEVAASAKTGGFTYEWICRKGQETETLEGETKASLNVKNIKEDVSYDCIVRDKYHNPITISFDIEIDEKLFADVADPSRYYYAPVYWAAEKGITVGAGGPGKFSPDAPCTREQIVTFLWRMMGEPEPEKHEKFTDVAKGAWYDKPISWAYENGITTGLNDGTGRFGVGQSCTRAMCVTFFYRSAGKPSYSGNPKFTDVKDPKAYYYDAVRWAAVNNITVGMNDGTGRFGIDVTCSRAMIVTFLYRYAGITNK